MPSNLLQAVHLGFNLVVHSTFIHCSKHPPFQDKIQSLENWQPQNQQVKAPKIFSTLPKNCMKDDTASFPEKSPQKRFIKFTGILGYCTQISTIPTVSSITHQALASKISRRLFRSASKASRRLCRSAVVDRLGRLASAFVAFLWQDRWGQMFNSPVGTARKLFLYPYIPVLEGL